MRSKAEVARGSTEPAHTSVMAGSGGGFRPEFLKSPRLTFSEILGPSEDPILRGCQSGPRIERGACHSVVLKCS
jgi:hypothetical protein